MPARRGLWLFLSLVACARSHVPEPSPAQAEAPTALVPDPAPEPDIDPAPQPAPEPTPELSPWLTHEVSIADVALVDGGLLTYDTSGGVLRWRDDGTLDAELYRIDTGTGPSLLGVWNDRVAIHDEEVILVLDWRTGATLHRLATPRFENAADQLAFSPSGERLAVASANAGTQRIVEYAIASARRVTTYLPEKGRSVEYDSGWHVYVAYSPDGTRLATLSVEDRMHDWGDGALLDLWRTGKSGSRKRLRVEPTMLDEGMAATFGRALSFTPDGTQLAVGNVDDRVRLYDSGTGTLVRDRKHDGLVIALAFSASGQRMAAATSAGLWLWDDGEEQPVATIALPNDDLSPELPLAIAFVDEWTIATAWGRHVWRWRPKSAA